MSLGVLALWVWHYHALSLFCRDHYLAYAGWVDDSNSYAVWLNRDQTYAEFCSYEYSNTECDTVSYKSGGGCHVVRQISQ